MSRCSKAKTDRSEIVRKFWWGERPRELTAPNSSRGLRGCSPHRICRSVGGHLIWFGFYQNVAPTALEFMKYALLILLLLPLLLSGCVTGYSSRIELRSIEVAKTAPTSSIEKEVGNTLETLGFHSVSEKDFWPVYPNLIAEWKLTKQRGFWLGGCTVTTALSIDQDSTVIIINCEDTESQKEVREIQDILQKTVEEKFPTLKIRMVAGYDVTAMPP